MSLYITNNRILLSPQVWGSKSSYVWQKPKSLQIMRRRYPGGGESFHSAYTKYLLGQIPWYCIWVNTQFSFKCILYDQFSRVNNYCFNIRFGKIQNSTIFVSQLYSDWALSVIAVYKILVKIYWSELYSWSVRHYSIVDVIKIILKKRTKI